jgi:hypothetical protein
MADRGHNERRATSAEPSVELGPVNDTVGLVASNQWNADGPITAVAFDAGHPSPHRHIADDHLAALVSLPGHESAKL